MQMEMSLAKLQIKCVFTKIYSFNSFPKGGTSRRPLVYLCKQNHIDALWIGTWSKTRIVHLTTSHAKGVL